MFWNKKVKLPITLEDQIWVEESLSFLKESLGEETLLEVKTVVPTKAFFNRDFDGTEADAHFILEQCKKQMHIREAKIQLEFYSETKRTLDDGTLVSTSADLLGKSSGAAGTYQKTEGVSIIRIDKGQLKHPENLIATISHELAHEKLLGENRIQENDEYLTDLTAIAFGFGSFIANARFQFQSGMQDGFGWQMQSQGYLPEQVTAYAMASLALKKSETHYDYKKYLNTAVEEYFDQSIAYLKSDKTEHDVTLFWTVKAKKEELKPVAKTEINTPVIPQEFSADELKKHQQEIAGACYATSIHDLKNLLEKGISPNFSTTGGSPLSIAVKKIVKKWLIAC